MMTREDTVNEIVALMAPHVGGWVNNGNPDIAHCRCGYRPRLGELHCRHVAEELVRNGVRLRGGSLR
jgi:hypothetical protein